MKVQAVNNYNLIHRNTAVQNVVKPNISFGFSEDYGDDSFLYETSDYSSGNILESIGCIIAFPFVWLQDFIQEKRAEKRGQDTTLPGYNNISDEDLII